jgi:hypothetical protein
MTGLKKATTETMNMADSKSGRDNSNRDVSNRDVSILLTHRLKGRQQLMLFAKTSVAELEPEPQEL